MLFYIKTVFILAHLLCVLCMGSHVNPTKLVQKRSHSGRKYVGYTFESRTGHWYKVYPEGYTWTNAYTTCRQQRAHLAIINSEVEAQVLIELYQRSRSSIQNVNKEARVAIGIYKKQSGVWSTVDDQSLEQAGYAKWLRDHPKLDALAEFGYIDSDGNLLNGDNYDRVAFICEKGPDVNTKRMRRISLPSAYKLGYQFESRTGHWYKFHSEGTKWDEANRICVSEGAHLAVINSDGEKQVLLDLLKKYRIQLDNKMTFNYKSFLAIGVYWVPSGAVWKTTDGQTLGHEQIRYIQGMKDQPSNINWARGYLDKDGTFTSEVYHARVPFICEKYCLAKDDNCGPDVKSTELVQHTSSPGEKDLGYEFVSRTGHWYKFHSEGATWEDASKTCVAEGAYLAVINSDGEERVLRDLFHKYEGWIHDADSKNNMPIGVHRDPSGSWRTTDGQTMEQTDSFMSFRDRGTYGFMQLQGTFNTWGLDERVAFICERNSYCPGDGDICDSADLKVTELLPDKSPWRSRLGYNLEPLTGQWYKLHTVGATWTDANRTCAAEEAHLAVINSRAEAAILGQLIMASDSYIRDVDVKNMAAIGIYKEPFGAWRTIDGQTLNQAGYSTWSRTHHAPGEMSVYGYMNNGGYLLSWNASTKVPFICEK